MATRWGTREEFIQACETAKAHGIDILIDAVLNVSLARPRILRSCQLTIYIL